MEALPSRIDRAMDLGSGGGVPGLPLAMGRPEAEWVLLDGSVTRGRFLSEAVAALGLASRVHVLAARAEEAGRSPEWRGEFDLVVARSFGSPAVTAECAAPFLRVGGTLVVAEPPLERSDRWPADGLAPLGLVVADRITTASSFQVLRQESLCPERYPRRTGIPSKRPLF